MDLASYSCFQALSCLCSLTWLISNFSFLSLVLICLVYFRVKQEYSQKKHFNIQCLFVFMSRTGIKELKATALGRPAVALGPLLIYLCEMVTDILTVDVHIHREHIFALWTFFLTAAWSKCTHRCTLQIAQGDKYIFNTQIYEYEGVQLWWKWVFWLSLSNKKSPNTSMFSSHVFSTTN